MSKTGPALEIDRVAQAKALASESRMAILSWLRDPATHFAHQIYADPVDQGVCVTLIAKKLRVSQPTASRHLDLLRQAGFIAVNRVERWSYYQRNEKGVAEYQRWLKGNV